MDQFDPARVTAILLAAPPTTLLALTVRDRRLRERAADRLAWAIINGDEKPHPDQLSLAIGW